MFFKIGVLKIFAIFNKKTPVLESLFKKVGGLKVHSSAPSSSILKNSFFVEHLWRLLLKPFRSSSEVEFTGYNLVQMRKL